MRLRQYIVDSFTDELFGGNPAAVCPLEEWLPDSLMQAIAAENNLSETAFIVADGDCFHIRWFTPLCEVNLCGHATLAAAFVVLREHPEIDNFSFSSRSGALPIWRKDDLVWMDFPATELSERDALRQDADAVLGQVEMTARAGEDFFVVLEDELAVCSAEPDLKAMAGWSPRGVIITARGDDGEFVSRFFAPNAGVPEDPVTGSAHCALAPFWAGQLGRKSFQARQLSRRGGMVHCRVVDDRVELGGNAVFFGETLFEVPLPSVH